MSQDTTITISGYILYHQQDRPNRGGGTTVFSWEGVALGVLNFDSGLHQVSRLQMKLVLSITDTSLQQTRFTPHDIKKRLETLDTANAKGADNIPATVLKTWAPELAAPLAKLFQYSYNTGIYPTWKIAHACPVCEKHVKSNPANYHTISLLLIISKVMEGVINSAIKQHLLSDAQFAFRQGHSVLDLITALVQTWTRELNSRGRSSQLQDISARVPQGNVLSPTIFNCFINDLPSIIRSEVGTFTNNCTMFSIIRDSKGHRIRN
eukprot:g39224.t1